MTLPPKRDGSEFRKRRSNRFPLPFERLEIRQLLSFTGSVTSPTSGQLMGDATNEQVTIDQVGNLLEHSTISAGSGGSFADNFDFDSTEPGSQHITASPSTILDLVNGGNDSFTIGSAASAAVSLNKSTFDVSGGTGTNTLTIDDSGSSGTGYSIGPNQIALDPNSSLGATIVTTSSFAGGVILKTSTLGVSAGKITGTMIGQPVTVIGSTSNNVTIGDGSINLVSAFASSVNLQGQNTSLYVTAQTSSGTTATLTGSSITGMTGPGTEINYGGFQTLNVALGNGTNALTVGSDSIPIPGPPSGTAVTTGSGMSTINVLSSASPLSIGVQGASDLVNIGDNGSLEHVTSDIFVDRNYGGVANPSANVTVDDSTDPENQHVTLERNTTENSDELSGYRSGFSLQSIDTFPTLWTVKDGSAADSLSIDSTQGNPILLNGLTYVGGGSSTLILQGVLPGDSRYENETANATGPGAGTITADGSTINFSGLKPIIDTTPADHLVFNDQTGGNSQITVGPGSAVGGQATTLISSDDTPPRFEQVSYVNKSNVLINAGPGDDVVSVVGYSLQSGTNTTIDGQGGNNVLNYYADGATVTVAAAGSSGQATLTLPGLGSLLVENFQRINVIGGQVTGVTVPPPPTFGTSPTVRGVDGMPLTNIDVATFTSSFLDSTSASFGATIDWGDGTSTAGTIVADASDPTIFHVEGSHTYATQGPAGGFTIAVIVNARLINTTSVPQLSIPATTTASTTTTALISDAALTGQGATVAGVEGVPLANDLIASFTYAGGSVPTSNFSGTVQWGDGTTSTLTSANFIPVPTTAAVATYEVVDTHMFANQGTFPIVVTIDSEFGSSAVASSTAIVSAAPLPPAPLNLTGTLNPASDTGVSDSDAITNNASPNFYGSAAPGTHIKLYAIPVGTTIAVPIGQTVANSVGAWSLTSIRMADGRYNIEAIGIDPTGVTSALDVILPNALQGPLVVDTVAPKVESVQYKPLSGQVIVTFQDHSSGLNEAQIINGANYLFTRVAALPGQANLKHGPGLPLPSSYVVTGLSTSPQTNPTAPQVVVVSINKNMPIRGGDYRLTIESGGIADVAGNALDGEFYGDFPSGNNLPGGTFVANLASVHNTVEPPLPVTSSASPLIPPGVKPTATTIPTVHAGVVTKTTVKSAAKPLVVHGKARPKVSLAYRTKM